MRLVSLHLSSVVLAAKSSFFRTLFTCGLKEHCNNNKPVVISVTQEGEGNLPGSPTPPLPSCTSPAQLVRVPC